MMTNEKSTVIRYKTIKHDTETNFINELSRYTNKLGWSILNTGCTNNGYMNGFVWWAVLYKEECL